MLRQAMQSFWLTLWLIAPVVFAVGCQPAYEFRGGVLDPPLAVPDFELMSSTGEPFRLSQTQGDLTLVTFGYTFCPDVCPLTLGQIKRVMNDLEESQRRRVHVLFISVDPERDTPEVLSRYMTAFDPTFIGLTDDPAKLNAVMAAFGAFAEKEVVADSAAGYLVSHTSRLYLIGPDSHIILQYGFDPNGSTIDDLRSDLAYLLNKEN